MICLIVLGNPITKKNSSQMVMNKRTGRWFPVPSKQYKAFEKQALEQLGHPVAQPIDVPVNIKYTFYMQKRNPVDGLNLSAAMDDILVKAKILADDNRDVVAGHDGTRVYHDKGNPRTEIEISLVDGYEKWKRQET